VALPQPILRQAVPLPEVFKRRLRPLTAELVDDLPKRTVEPGLVELMHRLPHLAAKTAGAPRPLGDFLKCSKADAQKVKKAAWTLSGAVKLAKRPPIEYYVKTVAARVNLPTPVVKKALEILERNRRLLTGKNPWVWAAAALWVASSRGLLKALAEAAGSAPVSVREAARRLRA
jgi:transcription initiation factor TFIIIB Brf1 subunit/transcription initiation factor TFIIB